MSQSDAGNFDLDQLGEYKIIGELAGREDAKTYLASRRDDGAPVLIAIARTPTDDDGNALSLLAADTNLLATLSHPNLLPIAEGRWIGTDAFAVITERVTAPTLNEIVAREELPFPRIAAILREVNGLLEWAREHKVVHRAVTPDTLFVENGSDRVLAAFAISPIPFGRVSPVGVDARTIGTLAKTMLSQHADVAKRVLEETERLLELSHKSETVPDMSAYIASIAMADALKQGEIEYAKASHAIENEQRAARERLEAERQQHDREMTEQREQFEKERAQYQRDIEKEHRALAKEREALATEPVVVTEPRAREKERVAAPASAPVPVRATMKPRSDKASLWNVGIVAGALLILAAVTTLAIGSAHRRAAQPESEPVATRAAAAPAVDSAAGDVVASIVPLPTSVPDSVWSAAADSDSAAARASRRERSARSASVARHAAEAAALVNRPAPTRSDPGFNLGFIAPVLRADSAAKRDSMAKSRRDSIVKRDTIPKRDSVAPRDTTRSRNR